MTKRLEAVYVANIILYLPSIETINKIIQVNKKCQEATKIIRYYNTKKLYENENNEKRNYVFVKRVFDTLPNIETVKCRYQDVLNNLGLFEKINQIELVINCFIFEILLPQEIKDKVIRLEFNCYVLTHFKLNEFPNLRKVIVGYSKEGYLKEFLGDNKLKLKQLIIQTRYDRNELNYLKEFDGIENKVIKFNSKLIKERYHELNSFVNVYNGYPVNGVDIKDTIGSSENLIISNAFDVNRLYDLTLFTKCSVETDCDLRNCELLEEINMTNSKKTHTKIQIKGLKKLKKIMGIDKVDCIPPSVTYLSFNPFFNYKELLQKDIKCFNNIKEVRLNDCCNEKFDSRVFMNFNNCTKIDLYNGNLLNKSFEFPMSVKELLTDSCDNSNQIEGIAKLKGLKKLVIYLNNNQFLNIQTICDNLKELESLTSDCIEGIKLPSTLTYLHIEVKNEIDLSQLTNLKEIEINCYSESDGRIKLPNKLNKLYLQGNIAVTNSNEVEINKIIFYGTNAQFCEWKSKNIFIEKSF